MNIKFKKIIARELLIFIIVLVIGFISFLCTYPYKWIKLSQLETDNNIISFQKQLADSLSEPFDHKTINGKDYLSRVYSALQLKAINHQINDFNYPDTIFRTKILTDKNYRYYIYKTIVKLIGGFDVTKPQFDEAINQQLTLEDIEQKEKSNRILENLKELVYKKQQTSASILTFNEQLSFGIKCTIIAIFLLFILRYLFYSITWSIKTLNQ